VIVSWCNIQEHNILLGLLISTGDLHLSPLVLDMLLASFLNLHKVDSNFPAAVAACSVTFSIRDFKFPLGLRCSKTDNFVYIITAFAVDNRSGFVLLI
jgi:hypothetical protein